MEEGQGWASREGGGGGAETGQSTSCPEIKLKTPVAGSAGVLNGWTLHREVLRPGSVSAERCVLPNCWGLDSEYLGSGSYFVGS